MVVSTSISHDLLKRVFVPSITEKQELLAARIAAAFAVLLAGYFGIMLVIVWWVVMQKQKTSADYFLAGRAMTWPLIGASLLPAAATAPAPCCRRSSR